MGVSTKEDGFIFSPWRIYHYKKIRDFCSNECFIKWFNDYFKQKSKEKVILETIKLLIDENDGKV